MLSKAHIKSHPIHPILITFPIGLWIAALIFDLLGTRGNALLTAAAYYAIIGGCIGAACAAIPGVIDLFGAVPERSSARNRGYLHGGLNSLALLLFIFIAARRGSGTAPADGLSLGLEFIGVALILFSGWLGGTLVYRNQIGVDHRYAGAGRFKQRDLKSLNDPVCNQSELSDGQMILADTGKDRMVVGKCPEGFSAFSNHCTHKGGPLSDGALVGCTVQCPWHGSQFDVHTGRVVAGPAERKIAVYETAVRKGEVYIQPDEAKAKKQDDSKKAA